MERARRVATSLIFLNNDIEARTEGWLAALRAQALRPDVGGCRRPASLP